MKLLCLGDPHFTGRRLSSRTDCLPTTQMEKFRQVQKLRLDYLDKGDDCTILVTGDFFDSASVGYATFNRYLTEIGQYTEDDMECYVGSVFGQHDLYMWNNNLTLSTPLGSLMNAGVVWDLNAPWGLGTQAVDHGRRFIPEVMIYGCSWGQDVPKMKIDKEFDGMIFKVLVIHGTIGDKPLFPGHKLKNPRAFADEHSEFDLIVCGDFHFPFRYKGKNGNLIINPGAMSRMKSSEKDIQPQVVMYDTLTGDESWLKLAYIPDVFITQPDKAEEDLDISDLLLKLSDIADPIQIDFESNVFRALKEENVTPDVKKLAIDIINNLKGVTA